MSLTETDWSFIHVSDMHVGTPRSYRFQPAWKANWETARRQIIARNPELLLVGGDMTRDGSTHRLELEQAKADLDQLPFPYHVIPGNHEVGNKYLPGDPVSIQPRYLEAYRSVFGASSWTLTHRGVQFSAFDAFLAGTGLPEEEQLWRWLESVERDPDARHHVWMIHPALFIEHLREPDWDIKVDRNAWYFGIDEPSRSRLFDIFKRTGADLVISGHIHCRRYLEVEGIAFQFAPATAFPQWGDRWPDGDDTLGFLEIDVREDSLIPRFIPLESVSELKGYGPGGNPPEEGRDYSVAWEQPSLAHEE